MPNCWQRGSTAGLDAAHEDRVRRLLGHEPLAAATLGHPLGLDDVIGRERRAPDIADLSGTHEITQGPERLVDIRLR